jgi:hypothetical protein
MSDAPQDAASERAEPDAVRARYARRAPADDRYRLTHPAALMAMQERQRAMLALFARQGLADLGTLRLVEVGSGGGGNLLELLQLGFRPEHLAGIELLPERHAAARARCPRRCGCLRRCQRRAGRDPAASTSSGLAVVIIGAPNVGKSSLLNRLAGDDIAIVTDVPGTTRDAIRSDIDVRGVPLSRLRSLFPQARLEHRRVTLAPPIARAVCRIHPGIYPLANVLPMLRTHVLCWLGKRPEVRPTTRILVE